MQPISASIKVACIMMQKNETTRLDAWIRYHVEVFGSRNLFIFDNGSTEPSVIRRLNKASSNGVTVIWAHNKPEHYLEKGTIIAEHIKMLDQNDPRDFYLPLDCDELVACITNEAISLQPTDIRACLSPHKEHPGLLKINGKFWHNPYRKDYYKYQLPKSKTFFAHGACDTLDLGFHEGSARLSQDKQDTNLVYIEFHYLAHKEQMEKSRAKLPNVSDFSTSYLKTYQGQSWHCAQELLMTEHDYAAELLTDQDNVRIPEILQRLDELGIDYRSFFAWSCPWADRWTIRLLRLRHRVRTTASATRFMIWRLGDGLRRLPARLHSKGRGGD